MIVLGTSGYHFKDWAGPFYPPELPSSEWLRYYAERFHAVEINSSYYGLPSTDSVARWVDQTPTGFRFFVKLNQETTHKRQSDAVEVGDLLERLEPMRASQSLHGLLAQFPASFHAGAEQRAYLERVAAACQGVPLFVELRHRSWDSAEAVELVRKVGAGWVASDAPALPSLAGPRPAVTGPAGYVRFHGRNRKTWYHPSAGDRYDWEYSERELQSWRPRLAAMDARAETTYLFFNNCHMGQAIKSAMKMRDLLDDQFEIL